MGQINLDKLARDNNLALIQYEGQSGIYGSAWNSCIKNYKDGFAKSQELQSREISYLKSALQKISEYAKDPTGETQLQRIERLKSIADKALLRSENSMEAQQLFTRKELLDALRNFAVEVGSVDGDIKIESPASATKWILNYVDELSKKKGLLEEKEELTIGDIVAKIDKTLNDYYKHYADQVGISECEIEVSEEGFLQVIQNFNFLINDLNVIEESLGTTIFYKGHRIRHNAEFVGHQVVITSHIPHNGLPKNY